LLFGAFSIADAFFAPVVTRFRTYGVPLSAQLAAYSDALLALPAMQQWVAAATAEAEVIEA
jgi:glutathione S-transferase